jgi:hypothetical protein
MIPYHITQRLNERKLEFQPEYLESLALNCNQDTAIILIKLNCHVGSDYRDYYARTESNGDLVILIVRESKPITIMFRRSNQKNTPQDLRVNQILDLTH